MIRTAKILTAAHVEIIPRNPLTTKRIQSLLDSFGSSVNHNQLLGVVITLNDFLNGAPARSLALAYDGDHNLIGAMTFIDGKKEQEITKYGTVISNETLRSLVRALDHSRGIAISVDTQDHPIFDSLGFQHTEELEEGMPSKMMKLPPGHVASLPPVTVMKDLIESLWGIPTALKPPSPGGAGCLFYCKATRKFLFPFRSALCSEPNTWGTWGGGMEPNEAPEATVKREASEEAGYTGSWDLEKVSETSKGDFTYTTYIAYVDEEFEPVLNWETEKAEWLEEWPEPLHFGLKESEQDIKDALLKKEAGKSARVNSSRLLRTAERHDIEDESGLRTVFIAVDVQDPKTSRWEFNCTTTPSSEGFVVVKVKIFGPKEYNITLMGDNGPEIERKVIDLIDQWYGVQSIMSSAKVRSEALAGLASMRSKEMASV